MAIPKYIPHYSRYDCAQWEGDWELWFGVPVAITPSPFGVHQRVVSRVLIQIGKELERIKCDKCEVISELDWIIANDLIVRPNLVVVCSANLERFLESAPVVSVEVLSAGTRHKDRTAKFQLYAEQNVNYYQMFDPNDETWEAFELENGAYHPLVGDPKADGMTERGCFSCRQCP